ncbi:MAG: hypothetical protein JO345_03030 [Streptosporangiaceae bacterium]|nr:hypothetical protein [Streptosporangiaceae bacterium]
MQLTSSTGALDASRHRWPFIRSATDQPPVVGLIALLAWLGFVLARWQIWARGNISRFVLLGTTFTNRRYLPSGMVIGDPNAKGYDGQFYYRLAVNPFNWHRTAYGITMDQKYRYTRIGYPILAWLGSFGQHEWVPVLLVAINLVGVAVLAALGAMFARDAGRHALWGLAFVAFFGLVISVGRDTAEPLAEACMLGGLLAYRHGRWLWSAAAFGYGGITRETILLAPAAIAVLRLPGLVRRKGWPARADLAWLVPGLAFGAVQLAAKLSLRGGAWPVVTDWDRNLTTPFTAMVDALRQAGARVDTGHLGLYDITLLESVTLGILVVAGLAVLFVTTAPVHERVAFVVAVVMVCALSNQIWGSVFGDGRSMIEPYLFALVLLVATPKRYLNAYSLGLVVAGAVPALYVVARRRILYM